jgi:hypothetical protein
MNASPDSTRISGAWPRETWLLVVALLLVAALALHGPITQWADYHAFADTRTWLGLPNAENVLSNLPFAVIGLWGLNALAGATDARRHAWRVSAAAVFFTAFGSAAYHWAPGNGALVFDRLPIAWACAALTCALLAERVDPRWARPMPILGALVAASAAVGWWWLTEQRGTGDLRPYLFVQFLPMLLVPAVALLKLPTRSASALAQRDWWVVLGLYAAAKLMELADANILEALVITSGHTLKHLLAAGAAWWLLRAANRPHAARR